MVGHALEGLAQQRLGFAQAALAVVDPAEAVEDRRVAGIERVGALDQPARLVIAGGAVGQGVAEGVERQAVVRLALDDGAQVALQAAQVAALLGEHGAGVQQVEVVRMLAQRLGDQLPGGVEAALLGQPLDLDQVQLHGVVGLAAAGAFELLARLVAAPGGQQQFAAAYLGGEEFVAGADRGVLAQRGRAVLRLLGEAAEVEVCGVDVGVAGDQQAATCGQACFRPGMMKSTYGTGCFALLNTGAEQVTSRNRLLTTIAYQLGGQRTYALEGSIFIAGAVVQWLRDGLKLIREAGETHALALSTDPGQDLMIVPAFTGLGAPWWKPEARGAVFGLTRNSGPADFVRAALESVGYQTRDLLEAMRADWGAGAEGVLRVDGGMSASDWTMQFLADIIGAPVDRPVMRETTALGAAWLAGMQAGLYPGPDEFAANWALDRRFEPRMDEATRSTKYARWGRAVQAVMAV